MGVDMPIKTENEGVMSLPLAQRIAVSCGNSAAQVSLSSTSADTPMGIACELFKKDFHLVLNAAVRGSRVKTSCHPQTVSIGSRR